MVNHTKTLLCDGCGEFEMEVSYTGVEGTQVHASYESIGLSSCPVCGSELTTRGDKSKSEPDAQLSTLVEDDPTEDELVYRAGVEVAERVKEMPTVTMEDELERVMDGLPIPERRRSDVRSVVREY